MSLCTRPRRWTLPSAAAMLIARRRKLPTSMGAPRRRSSGSPPGSSNTSMVRPRSRPSSSGRTAQAPSNSSFNPYSWARRARLAGDGCSAAGSTASTAPGLPSAPRRHARQKTRSPSSHKTWGVIFLSADPKGWVQLPHSAGKVVVAIGLRRPRGLLEIGDDQLEPEDCRKQGCLSVRFNNVPGSACRSRKQRLPRMHPQGRKQHRQLGCRLARRGQLGRVAGPDAKTRPAHSEAGRCQRSAKNSARAPATVRGSFSIGIWPADRIRTSLVAGISAAKRSA